MSLIYIDWRPTDMYATLDIYTYPQSFIQQIGKHTVVISLSAITSDKTAGSQRNHGHICWLLFCIMKKRHAEDFKLSHAHELP